VVGRASNKGVSEKYPAIISSMTSKVFYIQNTKA